MGEVIRFPDQAGSVRGGRYADAAGEATVIILPVVRIERDPDGSEGQSQSGHGATRRRRRRAAR
jgi:hypothetical protein